MHQMVIYGVSFDMVGKQPIVLLKSASSDQFLPIWIGHPEAAAILMHLQGGTTPRPMTHDLMLEAFKELDVNCIRIDITELRDQTFFSTITLQSASGETHELDARPSDAIALAMRCGAEIFASEEVIEESAVQFGGAITESDDVVDNFKSFLDNVSPDDFRSES